MIDAVDKHILSILLHGAETSKAEIARRIGLAPSAISERIRRLEQTGVIRGYEARLDARALHVPLLAFVFVREAKPTGGFDTAGALARVTGVEEVHKVAGEDCFLLKIRSEGPERLGTILDTEISVIPTVSGVRTTIVLRTVLEEPPLSGLPIAAGDGRPSSRPSETDGDPDAAC